jgi:hypothetical protein
MEAHQSMGVELEIKKWFKLAKVVKKVHKDLCITTQYSPSTNHLISLEKSASHFHRTGFNSFPVNNSSAAQAQATRETPSWRRSSAANLLTPKATCLQHLIGDIPL